MTAIPSTEAHGTARVRLGILDFGMVVAGKTAAGVLEETWAMATLAESLGYFRYWLVEHHERHYAWASPEIVLAVLARITRRIRLGSAAVLLPLYSPLKVAEVFRLLELICPHRIDLGVCAGLPADEDALRGLVEDPSAARGSERHAKKVEMLLAYLGGHFPEGHRFDRGPTPIGGSSPEVWLMGTGRTNARLSAQHGAALSYSLFHRGSTDDPALAREYRETFRPGVLKEPRCSIAFSAVCADTEQEAQRHRILVEPFLKGDIRVNVVGNPEQCKEQILEISHRYASQDLIVHSLWPFIDARAASYQMMADVLALPRPHGAASGSPSAT